MKNKTIIWAWVFLVGAECSNAHGTPVRIGETVLEPEVELLYFKDDNVYASSDQEIEGNGYLLTPKIDWYADKGLNRLSFNYTGDYVRHDDIDQVDYTDHNVSIKGELEFSVRSRLSAVARYVNDHENPGTGRSRDLDTEVNGITKYDDTGISLTYQYGALSAKGGMEFGLEHVSRDYKNNSQVTDGYSFNRLTPSFNFLYAVSSATRILSGIEYSTFDYESAEGITESDNNSYFVFTGARWEITGKTGGSFRIGYGAQNYDSTLKDDQSSALIRLNTYWEPLSYSRFTLDGSRSFSVDTDSPSVNNNLTFSWKHDWAPRIATRFGYSYREVIADNPDDDSTTNSLSLELILNTLKWADFRLIGTATDKESPVQSYKFKKQWLGVGLNVHL